MIHSTKEELNFDIGVLEISNAIIKIEQTIL